MIRLEIDQSICKPGDTLRVKVAGDRVASAKTAELRLFWFTQGKGTRDAEVVESAAIAKGAPVFSFDFKLPDGPISFSGELITLTWAVEAVIDSEFERKEFVLSPFGHEILITGAPARSGSS